MVSIYIFHKSINGNREDPRGWEEGVAITEEREGGARAE